MRFLFVKEFLAWPRSSGHDVHCFHMMLALVRLGHSVGFLSRVEPAAEATAGLETSFRGTFSAWAAEGGSGIEEGWLQRRFRQYWGVNDAHVNAVRHAAEEMKADAVVVVGLDVLPYLVGVGERLCVWYAADEWLWHHVSQVRGIRRDSFRELKEGLIKGAYERAYRQAVDRIWVVTNADRHAMRWVTGVRHIDVIANGVDAQYFAPTATVERPKSCTFWGRLDFGPNIQALEWFCCRVWPILLAGHPEATFTVYGFQPSPKVGATLSGKGMELVPNLPDIRGAVCGHQVVVLPFVSGGGVKNKFLEAAALARPIVCSARALNGIRRPAECGAAVAASPEEWARAIEALWGRADMRLAAGSTARAWVVANHSWEAAAKIAVDGLENTTRSSN